MAVHHIGIEIEPPHDFDNSLAEKDKPVMVVLVVPLTVRVG
tara:strand:+ start:1052 stop:1174 length:123 start_codon:yes stop_codon:yes gene_type:complete